MPTIFQPVRKLLYESIQEHAHILTGEILDVGSGKSRYKSLFVCEKYTTLDPDESNTPDIVSTAERIPTRNATFDGILCTQVLGDVYDLKTATQEFYRVLKPGGSILLTEEFCSMLHDEPHDYWRFTRYSLQALLEEEGFQVQAIHQLGGFYTTRAQLSVRYWIDRLQAYERWYRRPFSFIARIYSKVMMFFDSLDQSKAGRRLPSAWLVIAEKPAVK